MAVNVITSKLAEFAIETPTSDVPDVAMDAACNGMIDVMACALAGTLEPAARIAANWVADAGAKRQVTVWGRSLSTSADLAAFANGVAAHALDFDDSHPSVRGHASASLVPTAIAVGEASGASGEAILAAYAIGIEVAGKMGRAFGHGLVRGGWHPTAVVGAIASTAVAARLFGHDAATLRRAWGIAGSEVGGLVRNFGTMTKPLHAGHAARSGVVAASLAGAGMTADSGIFEGAGGVLDVYGAEGESPEELVNELGKVWEIVEPGNFVKQWPCCYSNHRVIGALFRLVREHGITADEVENVVVSFLPSGDSALVSRQPKTGLEGKFSIEYVVAALLLDGALTLETFTDEMVMRPEAQALIGKVRRETIPDTMHYTGLVGYNMISVATKLQRFETREDRTPGSPAWPLSETERSAKFMSCASLALGEADARALLGLLRMCRQIERSEVLGKATVPHPALASARERTTA